MIPVAIRRWRKAWFSAPIKVERKAFREAVQAVKYDAIIDARAGEKRCAGHPSGARRQAWYGLANGPRAAGQPVLQPPPPHCETAARGGAYPRAVRQKPRLRETPNPGDYAIARHFLQHEASAAAPYLVFLHATTRDDKHWPENRWQELLDLLADSGVRIKLPWGAPHEEARAKRLAEGREYVEVLPRMSLEQVAQVLASARAVVSVDTGLSHLTAALDKSNFTLYGPTDPGLIGGYGKNQHIVRPENSASTGDITASRVHLLLQNQGLL